MGRPSAKHQAAEGEVFSQLKKGGPGGRSGGWVFLPEVSVRFPTDEEVDLTIHLADCWLET